MPREAVLQVCTCSVVLFRLTVPLIQLIQPFNSILCDGSAAAALFDADQTV